MRHTLGFLAAAVLVLATGSGGVFAQQQLPQAPINPLGAQSLATQTVSPQTLAQVTGVARTAQNGQVPYATLRLRDAATGRIAMTTNANETGAFTFTGVKPGYYVVELVDRAGNVLTTSPLITANAGDIVSTLVKLPLRIVPGAFVGGATSAGAGTTAATTTTAATAANVATIAAVASAAASAGVLAVAATGQPVSPQR
ncbi:MAG: carboxypeptidase regulatory-like domain-containing protein [Acidobacteriota bacterium]|nr:carboxypeptidase regulatory-like domain-containing protein [Acidobacteriota bacterium]